MEYITLKNTNISVSRLCMGGCPMGGYGWGNVSESELIDAVRAALDCGVNFFDTADTYGLGQSEKTLAKALSGDRNKAVIATKFGVRVENSKTFYDNSPEYIVKALDASLKRLGTDHVDLYQIHYRDGVTPLDAVVETLERQKKPVKYSATVFQIFIPTILTRSSLLRADLLHVRMNSRLPAAKTKLI